ncbi:MAG: tetratricopeptide repeat protein [Chloroflexi bacterium]|nr:tetratricopeptide repeat protein [Chloroflexota bacterium]
MKFRIRLKDLNKMIEPDETSIFINANNEKKKSNFLRTALLLAFIITLGMGNFGCSYLPSGCSRQQSSNASPQPSEKNQRNDPAQVYGGLSPENIKRLDELEKITGEKYSTLEDYGKDPGIRQFLSDMTKINPETKQPVITNRELAYGLNEFRFVCINDKNFRNDLYNREPETSFLRIAFSQLMKEDEDVRENIEEKIKKGIPDKLIAYEDAINYSKWKNKKGSAPASFAAAEAALLYVKGDVPEAIKIARNVPPEERKQFIFGMLLTFNRDYRESMQASIQTILSSETSPNEKGETMLLNTYNCREYAELLIQEGADPEVARLFLYTGHRNLDFLLPIALRDNWEAAIRSAGLFYKAEGKFEESEKYLKRVLEISRKTDNPKLRMDIYTNLFDLYTAWNKPQKAEYYKRKLEKEKTSTIEIRPK